MKIYKMKSSASVVSPPVLLAVCLVLICKQLSSSALGKGHSNVEY